MSFTVGPERYSAPPKDTCAMPAFPASAKQRIAAFTVCDELPSIAWKAKPPTFAWSSISTYTSGVAMGMWCYSVGQIEPGGSYVGSIPQQVSAAERSRRHCRLPLPAIYCLD